MKQTDQQSSGNKSAYCTLCWNGRGRIIKVLSEEQKIGHVMGLHYELVKCRLDSETYMIVGDDPAMQAFLSESFSDDIDAVLLEKEARIEAK